MTEEEIIELVKKQGSISLGHLLIGVPNSRDAVQLSITVREMVLCGTFVRIEE